MKKLFLLLGLFSMIFLAGCGKKSVSNNVSSVSNPTSVTNTDLTQNIKPVSNIENIQTIPLIEVENTDCSKYGGNETLKMADKNCSGLPSLGAENENGYVVGESNTTQNFSSSKNNEKSGLVEIKNEATQDGKKVSLNSQDHMSNTNTQNDEIFSKDITRNGFYHPDHVPVYGPGIHVNDTNANIKMGYGPYETNTDLNAYSKGYKN